MWNEQHCSRSSYSCYLALGLLCCDWKCNSACLEMQDRGQSEMFNTVNVNSSPGILWPNLWSSSVLRLFDMWKGTISHTSHIFDTLCFFSVIFYVDSVYTSDWMTLSVPLQLSHPRVSPKTWGFSTENCHARENGLKELHRKCLSPMTSV